MELNKPRFNWQFFIFFSKSYKEENKEFVSMHYVVFKDDQNNLMAHYFKLALQLLTLQFTIWKIIYFCCARFRRICDSTSRKKTCHFSILSDNKRIVSVLIVFHFDCAHNLIWIDNMSDLMKFLHLVFSRLHRSRCHLIIDFIQKTYIFIALFDKFNFEIQHF